MRAALLLGVALLTLPGLGRAESLSVGTVGPTLSCYGCVVGADGVLRTTGAGVVAIRNFPDSNNNDMGYAQEIRDRVKAMGQQTLDYARSVRSTTCSDVKCSGTLISSGTTTTLANTSGTNTAQTNGCLKYRSDGSFMTVPCEAITNQPSSPKEIVSTTLTQPKKGTTTMEVLGGLFIIILGFGSMFGVIWFVFSTRDRIEAIETKIKEREAAEGATEEEIIRVADAVNLSHDRARAAIIALRAV